MIWISWPSQNLLNLLENPLRFIIIEAQTENTDNLIKDWNSFWILSNFTKEIGEQFSENSVL